MQIEFRAIVQSEYDAPYKVLRIAKRQLRAEELGTDDVLVRVSARPVHPGDIQIFQEPFNTSLVRRKTGIVLLTSQARKDRVWRLELSEQERSHRRLRNWH